MGLGLAIAFFLLWLIGNTVIDGPPQKCEIFIDAIENGDKYRLEQKAIAILAIAIIVIVGLAQQEQTFGVLSQFLLSYALFLIFQEMRCLICLEYVLK
jgi:hypothetical protein